MWIVSVFPRSNFALFGRGYTGLVRGGKYGWQLADALWENLGTVPKFPAKTDQIVTYNIKEYG
jgi:hypothetical protein